MTVIWITIFMYTLSFLCLINMLWYGCKGEERKADIYGIVGLVISLFTTAAALFYLGGVM